MVDPALQDILTIAWCVSAFMWVTLSAISEYAFKSDAERGNMLIWSVWILSVPTWFFFYGSVLTVAIVSAPAWIPVLAVKRLRKELK